MFNVALFIGDHFQDSGQLIGLVKAYGVAPPTTEAVSKWRQRNVIPGPWFPVILAVLELENGIVPSLLNYVSFGARHGGQRRKNAKP